MREYVVTGYEFLHVVEFVLFLEHLLNTNVPVKFLTWSKERAFK